MVLFAALLAQCLLSTSHGHTTDSAERMSEDPDLPWLVFWLPLPPWNGFASSVNLGLGGPKELIFLVAECFPFYF